MRFIALILLFLIFTGCLKNQLGKVTGSFSKSGTPQITSVSIVNDQVIVTGTNLSEVDSAEVQGTLNHTFDIESKSETQVVLNARAAIGFLIGGTFDLIIGSAHGAATFPISFDLADGQVTSPKLHNMGAGSGQVLTFNGTNWVPGSASGSQVYSGTYNATTDTPDIVAAGGPAGTFYIVTVAGTQDLGTGNITFAVGDWVIFDGTDWSKVPLSSASVSSFNGRLGAVVPLADDYTWDMLDKTGAKITGSSISEIEDVDLTGLADDDILKWDSGTSKWVVTPLTSNTASGNFSLGANYLSNDGGAEGISIDTVGRTTITTSNGAVSGALTLANASSAVGSGNAITLKNGTSNQVQLSQEVTSVGNSDFSISSLTANTITEKFRILSSGNVGIGNANPTFKLDVTGDIRSTANIQAPYLVATGNANVAYAATSGTKKYPHDGNSLDGTIFASNTNATDGFGAYYISSSRNTDGNAQNAYFGVTSNTGAGVYTPNLVWGQQTGAAAYTERMRIDASGRIGMGTTSPTDVLSVGRAADSGKVELGFNSTQGLPGLTFYNGNGVLSGELMIVNNTDNAQRGLFFNTPGVSGASGTGDNFFIARFGGASNKIYYGDNGTSSLIQGGHQLQFTAGVGTGPFSNAASHLMINSSGNVGIGTTTINEKLEVSGGNIAATSGQVYSTRQTSAAASPLTVNANSGNVMVWTTNTASPTANLHNLKPGGSYMLVVAGTGTGTVTINCYSDAGVTALPTGFVPANGSRVDGTLDKSVYTIMSDGSNCLITWITGF